MKNFEIQRGLATSFLALSLGISHGVEVLYPDGDFTSGQGGWIEEFGNGTSTFEYPLTGGNPDGYGIIDNVGGGGYALWNSVSGDPILLADLGLSAGETYTFSQDMLLLGGPTVGGVKVVFFTGGNETGSTGDLFSTTIGDGSIWETYTFDVAIPAGADGIKLIPLWGADSRVGYDNFRVETVPLPAVTEIPDADFEAGDGVAWETNSGVGSFVFNFPSTGGNPGGYGEIDHSANDGGWGLLVTSNGQILPLAGLGLTAGEAYVFEMDMRIFSGSNLGGFKVDFFNGAAGSGSTGDIFPELIGAGNTWETYEFQVNIPVTATGLKLVPLWGPGSVVGYDNLSFDTEALVIEELAEIPNGDLEEGSMSWIEAGGETTVFTYETSGGNPDGHVVMDNNGTGFGVLISNSGAVIPIAGLGLEAGETYSFQQDMRLFSGSQIGGVKVEFFQGAAGRGDTGDLFPTLIGDGSTWETYEFEVSIPFGVDGFKLVPLWGSGSRVGYDNFTVDPVALVTPPVSNFDFEAGSQNWSQFGVGTTFNFLPTGGNPGGFAEMTNNGSGDSFGVLVSNASSVTPISKFGIVGGGNYDFQMDMRIISGSNIGGLKVEYYIDENFSGDTGDLFPVIIGDGSTWETYTFDVFIPAGVNGLKVVPLWGPGSVVGFDNVISPSAPTEGFEAWIADFPGVGGLTELGDDPDGDGVSNQVENFLGTDPSEYSSGLTVYPAAAGEIGFLFSHSVNAEPVDEASVGRYEWSVDLENFYANGEAAPDGMIVNFNSNPGISTTGTTRVVRATSSSFGTVKGVFFRLEVSAAE